jgi:hypothetical protein
MMRDRKHETKARALAERMNAAVAGLNTFEEWAPVVIETLRGCGSNVWITYDDAGGNAHSWTKPDFHKVRQVRNHPVWGRKLFDAVEGRDQAG